MERGYMETMAGATYCVMPSLYEPFGGATEPYLKGTPVIVRATGGLVEQVVDLRSDRTHATGLLYREQPLAGEAHEIGPLWRDLQTCGDPLARCENALYEALVASLAAALEQAVAIYQHDPAGYALMLSNLYTQSLRFSWTRAAAEYGVLYDLATA
jgi:glycogen synthase